MSAANSMTMRADIERDAQMGTDAWGHAKEAAWAGVAFGVPCLAYASAKREAVAAGGGGAASIRAAVLEDIRIMMPLGTDVTEKDRIVRVKDRAGALLFPGPFNVEGVQRRRDHLELIVTKAAA
ncbi:MAG: hypothetical protein AAB368_03440 [bacterium]